MSVGYAELLAPRADVGGTLGGPETHEGARSLLGKMARLAAMIRDAKAAIDSGTPLELPGPQNAADSKLPPKKMTTKPQNGAGPCPASAAPPPPPPPRRHWDPTRPHASPLVVFTGAGISTSCGIPDFRGPNGVWTLRAQGLRAPPARVTFSRAAPSLAHMALVRLQSEGLLSLVVSQNVDGLHLRSGLPRQALAELHGDCFAERCGRCEGEFVRDFEMPSVGFKPTGRSCAHPEPLPSSSLSAGAKKKKSPGAAGALAAGAAASTAPLPVPACFVANGNPPATELLGAARPPHEHHPHENHHHHPENNPLRRRCNGPLRDQCLDWDDPLPPKELRAAEALTSSAAVALCLGTSLQIRPAGDLPLRAPKGGGALAIVNLQQTPKDRRADVVCRGSCDEAAAALLDALGLEVADYARHDRVLVSHAAARQEGEDEDEGGGGGGGVGGASPFSWGFELTIGSVHGAGAPLPMVRRVEVSFEQEGGGGGDEEEVRAFDLGPTPAAEQQQQQQHEPRTPLVVRRSGLPATSGSVTAVLRLTLVDDEDGDGGNDSGDGNAAAARVRELRYEVLCPPPSPPPSTSSSSPAPVARGAATLTFETQRVPYAARQRAVVRDLRRRAAAEEEEAEAAAAAAKSEGRPPPPAPRRPRAPAARSQRYSEREAATLKEEEEQEEEEEEEEEDDDDGDFVPSSRARRASPAGAAAARASSRRLRKAAKLLDV